MARFGQEKTLQTPAFVRAVLHKRFNQAQSPRYRADRIVKRSDQPLDRNRRTLVTMSETLTASIPCRRENLCHLFKGCVAGEMRRLGLGVPDRIRQSFGGEARGGERHHIVGF